MTPSRTLAGLFFLLSMLVAGPGGAAEIGGSLVIAGNGPEQAMVETLAHAFEKAHPRAYVDVLWDDQSNPLEMVKTGQAHIALTGLAHSGLASAQIGWDGIGILVHLSNFTKDITQQQAADIFSGKIREWSQLGGPDTTILLIDRPRNHHIRDAFTSQLGITEQVPDTAKTIGPDDQAVRTVVGTIPPLSAVTYISLNTGLSVVASGVAVRLLPVDKIEPEIPTVQDGRYRLRRPILLVSKPEAGALIKAFEQFALSAQGQSIIGNTYIPLRNP